MEVLGSMLQELTLGDRSLLRTHQTPRAWMVMNFTSAGSQDLVYCLTEKKSQRIAFW